MLLSFAGSSRFFLKNFLHPYSNGVRSKYLNARANTLMINEMINTAKNTAIKAAINAFTSCWSMLDGFRFAGSVKSTVCEFPSSSDMVTVEDLD